MVGPLLGVVRGEGGSIKANKEGGGCVNTQTGSVGLISSQSNIVYGENEDSLENKCEAVPQPSMDDVSIMKNGNSVKSAGIYANKECDKLNMNMKNVSGKQSVNDVEACNGDSMKSMSGVQPEGSIRKKVNTSSKPSTQRLRGSANPNSNA